MGSAPNPLGARQARPSWAGGCLELVAVQLHVGCKRALWPVKERGKHLPRLVAVVVDRLRRERTSAEQGLGSGEGGGGGGLRLLAQDDHLRLLALHERLEDLGDVQWQRVLVRDHVDRTVRAHRERSPQLLLRGCRTDGRSNDLSDDLLLL